MAAKDFPVAFERRILTVPYRGAKIELPVHLYSVDGDYAARPVLLAHGGVDTFKMDFHPFCLAFTQGAGVTTLAIDHAGYRRNANAPGRRRRRGDRRRRGLRAVDR